MTHAQTPRWYVWSFAALALVYVAIHVGAWQAMDDEAIINELVPVVYAVSRKAGQNIHVHVA